MTGYDLSLTLPVDMYDALYNVARASGWALEDVVLRTLRNGMPPSLKKVPEQLHGVLLALNEENDQALWDILSGRINPPEPPAVELNEEDFYAIWRAYAFALLKWRGHPIPEPHEFIE